MEAEEKNMYRWGCQSVESRSGGCGRPAMDPPSCTQLPEPRYTQSELRKLNIEKGLGLEICAAAYQADHVTSIHVGPKCRCLRHGIRLKQIILLNTDRQTHTSDIDE